jgi:hypothetical protein
LSRKKTILVVSLFALSCLAIGTIWTLRTEPPSLNPWWAGKDAKVRIEVWEEGKDMATVAMTLNKRTLDAMVAFGMSPTFEIDDGDKFQLKRVWKQVQSLPPGKRLQLREDEATIYIWIEAKGIKPPAIAPPESAGAGL